MKKFYLLLTLLSNLTFAQLASPSGNVQATTNPSSGNVGIGTNNPTEKLEVMGNLKVNSKRTSSEIRLGNKDNNAIISDDTQDKFYGGGYFFRVHNESLPHKFTDALMLTDNGNIGVGTNNPSEKLEVIGNLLVNTRGTYSTIRLGSKINNAIISDGTQDKFYGGGYFFRVHNESLPHKFTDALMLTDNGNIGIGINKPKYKLDVNGTIHSKEVKVDMDGWADYVFKENYNLPTLQEVEKHIQEKGHLQNIPSEKEIIENGLSLAENQKLLLQKIEELTLYIIEQNKKSSEQDSKIDQLTKEIQNLKNN